MNDLDHNNTLPDRSEPAVSAPPTPSQPQSQQMQPMQQINVTASNDGTAIGIINGNPTLEMTPELLDAAAQIFGNKMVQFLQQTQGTLSLRPDEIKEQTHTYTTHAVEWAKLDQTRFNVFVIENENYDCGAFSIGRRVALTKNTSLEYKDHFRPLTPDLIAELANMPCIFAVRNPEFKKASEFYPAFLGKLTGIQRQGENLRFNFVVFATLKQQFINDNIRAFRLTTATVRNQLDEEHWSIRRGNLLQIAADMGIEIR